MSVIGPDRPRNERDHTDGQRPENERLTSPHSGLVYASTTLHVTGISITAVSLGMLACAGLESVTTDVDTAALVASGLISLVIGGLLWNFTSLEEIRDRQVFSTVGWTWITTTLIGTLPFVLAGTFAIEGSNFTEQIVNSVFESASGFSGTGSTALADFSRPGQGLLMYRQITQWYGGMGVVVLAVAVLPFLGVGGLELIAAEAPGLWSDRLTPRISETARHLWRIYIGLTVAAALTLFAIPGPSLYDSVAHAFTVASNGGFSPYANSIGHFNSAGVESAVIVFMVLGGINFSLHWRAVNGWPGIYWRDSEFRSYLGVLVGAACGVVALLWLSGSRFGSALRAGVFNVISIGTSTGFSNATGPGSIGDYVTWAAGGQLILLFLMVVGGCTGSTAGGIKVMRMQILGIVAVRSMRTAQNPRAVFPVRLGRFAIPESIVARVVSFYLLHALLVTVGLLVITALGAEMDSALGAVVSALGNMGPALGEAGPTGNYSTAFSQPARLVLALMMVIGRLEIVAALLMAAQCARSLRSACARFNRAGTRSWQR